MYRLPQGCKIAKTLKINITLVYVCGCMWFGRYGKVREKPDKVHLNYCG